MDKTTLVNEVRHKCPSISRWVEFFYAKPSRLYYNESVMSSAKGVQQGDPLGPLLFSLTLHPLVCKIAAHCSLALHAWYLDDGTIIGDTLEVSKALKIIQNEGSTRGLHLNINKTDFFWPNSDPRSFEDGDFPADIGRASNGVKLLGGPVSLDAQFCGDLVMTRVDKTIQLMNSVKKLQDPQCELLLLRYCTGVSKLYFTLRTTSPKFLHASSNHFDHHLFQFLQHLVTGDGAGFGSLQQRLATLPIKDGGLGVYRMTYTSQYCFLASCIQTGCLQATILKNMDISATSIHFQSALNGYMKICGLSSSTFTVNDTVPHLMKTLAVRYFDMVKRELPNKFTLSARDTTLWQSNKVVHALDFLKAIPIVGLNQTLGPRQFRSILQYKLGVPLFGEDSTCPCCNHAMDIFGDHVIHLANEVGGKFRHDLVRDVVVDICYRDGVAAGKEVSLSFLAGGTTSKPTYIMVYNWENDQDTCLDVTGISPLSGGGLLSFTPRRAISTSISRKRAKYLDKCMTHGLGFGVLAFTTLGDIRG